MHPMNGIRGNKLFHEMFPTAMICQSEHQSFDAIKHAVWSTQ